MTHDLSYQLGVGWRCKRCDKRWTSKRNAPEMMYEACEGEVEWEFTWDFSVSFDPDEAYTAEWSYAPGWTGTADPHSSTQAQLDKGQALIDAWEQERGET